MKDDIIPPLTADDIKDLSDGVSNYNTIDLGGYGASTYTISTGYGADTITLDPSIYTTSITVPTSSSFVNVTGAVGSTTSTSYYTTGSVGSGWGNVNISHDGIVMGADTDLKIDGKSLKEFMNKMEERLAILVPDPKKLEKFEALKKAYEHYKLMEKLCQEETKEEK